MPAAYLTTPAGATFLKAVLIMGTKTKQQNYIGCDRCRQNTVTSGGTQRANNLQRPWRRIRENL